jgi:hypothetical protein
MAFLTMEVLGRYARTRAVIGEHVFSCKSVIRGVSAVPARARTCSPRCTRLVPAGCCLFSEHLTRVVPDRGGETRRGLQANPYAVSDAYASRYRSSQCTSSSGWLSADRCPLSITSGSI